MGYPLRHYEPQTIYFLTSRTRNSRFFMSPNQKTNELIGGILARAVRKSGVELFAYVFTSNHFHAMVRASSGELISDFMKQLKSSIAIKVGRFIDASWPSDSDRSTDSLGPFFGRRYSSEAIVDEGAQVKRLTYILRHGVKEGLVSRVKDWPGLSCARALLEGGAVSHHRWLNWTRRWRMKIDKKVNVARFSEECPSEPESLTLSPLPCWKALTAPQRALRVAQLIEKIDAKAPNKTRRDAEHIIAQNPFGQPKQTKRTPGPRVHASTKERKKEAIGRYRAFVAAFRYAASEWLNGKFDVKFPLHCFRPRPRKVVQPARSEVPSGAPGA